MFLKSCCGCAQKLSQKLLKILPANDYTILNELFPRLPVWTAVGLICSAMLRKLNHWPAANHGAVGRRHFCRTREAKGTGSAHPIKVQGRFLVFGGESNKSKASPGAGIAR